MAHITTQLPNTTYITLQPTQITLVTTFTKSDLWSSVIVKLKKNKTWWNEHKKILLNDAICSPSCKLYNNSKHSGGLSLSVLDLLPTSWEAIHHPFVTHSLGVENLWTNHNESEAVNQRAPLCLMLVSLSVCCTKTLSRWRKLLAPFKMDTHAFTVFK